jgi:hypothetical protein
MTQAVFLSTLISVMVGAGALGGTVNYFFARKLDAEKSNIAESIVVGIAAAFLVPLFLNMISSNLTEEIRGNSELSKILVFAGFCLIAAISSKAFIKTLSERVLKEVEETKKQVQETKKELQEAKKEVAEAKNVALSAQEKASEADAIVQKNIESPDGPEISSLLAPMPTAISETARTILLEFATGEKVYRTRTSVARHIEMEKSEVDRIVDELKEQGLVDVKMLEDASGPKKRRWYITQKGRVAIATTS